MYTTFHKEECDIKSFGEKIFIGFDVDKNDIYNWLTSCCNADELEFLGRSALRQAKSIREDEQSSFKGDFMK